MRPVAKKPTSRAPESFCGAWRGREEVAGGMEGKEAGQTVSRWWARRDLSEMMRMRENSSRTAI
jgi:hypothetical protein